MPNKLREVFVYETVYFHERVWRQLDDKALAER